MKMERDILKKATAYERRVRSKMPTAIMQWWSCGWWKRNSAEVRPLTTA